MSSDKQERWRREEDPKSTRERGEMEEREKRRLGEEERERSPTFSCYARKCAYRGARGRAEGRDTLTRGE